MKLDVNKLPAMLDELFTMWGGMHGAQGHHANCRAHSDEIVQAFETSSSANERRHRNRHSLTLRTCQMTYSTIQPPFTLQFRDMAKKDLIAYATWFHDSAPGRIAELTGAVKGTLGFERWEPNMTPESVEDLSRWFESQVETRKKAHEEIEETRAKLTFPIDIPDEELTNRTFSLAMDIGMYFAQVVLKNLPGTRWDQPLGNKKFADYGQPVIIGFGTVPLNPVRVIVTNAYKAANKEWVDLRRLYDTWARMKRRASSLHPHARANSV